MTALHLFLPAGDKKLLLAWLFLCCLSLATLWSVTEPIRGPYLQLDPGVHKDIFYRQLMWVLVSYLALVVVSRLSLRHLDNLAIPIFLITVALLLLILVAGPRIGGARRWLVLGPLRLQPSELAKAAFLLVNANILSRALEDGRRLSASLLSLFLMLVPLMLVLREPDLGTSLVFLAVWIGMIFWFGMPVILLLGAGSAAISAVISFYSETVVHQAWPWAVYLLLLLVVLYFVRLSIVARVTLLGLNIATGIGIPFFWERFQPYQQERILSFFDPSRDAFGSGYQAIQSKVAIGSGGLFGTHYLQGTQKGLAFLPERHTDFIYSVVGEELGFLGAVVLLAAFCFIILRAVDHARDARQPFASFVAIGVATYFTFHVVVNVAITTGLLPVTGLPLPLISYGGSNLLASSVLLGLLLNVSSRTFED